MANKPPIQWVQAHPNNWTAGRSGTPIRKITFHHVVGSDDSAINAFLNSSRAASAHFVVGDTKITQMVDLNNTAWCNGNWASNLESITIEHEGDWRFGYYNQAVIDNSAQLVAWLRTIYPGIGFNRHREVSTNGTVCPADLPVETIWNKATELLNPPAPVTPPPAPAVSLVITDVTNRTMVTNKVCNLWDLNFTSWATAKSVKQLASGTEIEVSATARHPLGGTYYLTEYSYSKGINNGINAADLSEKVATPPPVTPPPVDPEPPVIPEPPVEPPVVPPTPPVDPNLPTEGEDAVSWLTRIFAWIKTVLSKFTFKK